MIEPYPSKIHAYDPGPVPELPMVALLALLGIVILIGVMLR